MFKLILNLLVFGVVLCSAFPFPAYFDNENVKNCGYQSCHPLKEGFINVHLVPHTHDDVGWLKTVDQYYYGSRTEIQNAGVQYILDSVLDSLSQDKNRRFIYVETSFFWKWWIHQHDTVKAKVRKFVNNGQLEFIGGAWSMNDEATTNYQSIIDQFTWGLRKLNDTFGECGRPKIGWQIDPFGHSREQASIFAQLGFDGLLLGRIDYQEKSVRLETKTAEMVWRGSDSLGEESDIFTGAMYNTYAPPRGFCFDIMCNDDPIIDDKKSPDYNVDQKIDDFFDYLKNVTNGYVTDNIILTMGEDFHYQDANVWFKNLDKLILYANQRQANGSKYNLIYSTPSCYVKSIYDSLKNQPSALKLKTDDFFPYASDPNAFWTGYFTSRPTIKRFEREGNNFLQVCKQLYALTDLDPSDRVDLNALRQAMGIMQHHDAITGTEKEHVASDYSRILTEAFEECEFIASAALKKITMEETEFSSCLLTNTSSCPISEASDNFVVTVYNPLSRKVNKFVRLPVAASNYQVSDPSGNDLTVQLIPTPKPIINIPGRQSKSTFELIFEASNIPPFGFKSFNVKRKEGNEVLEATTELKDLNNGATFELDPNTGLISSATINNVTIPISQNFHYYEGAVGDNTQFEKRSSGAYIFRPNGSVHSFSEPPKYEIYQGELLAEVHQTFNEWASQVIRVYNNEPYIEFDWLIGPLPSDGPNGKEVISRFESNLKSDSTFYTDSNGREMLKRVRNFRPTWNLNLSESIAGNYYPITSKIVIKDEEQKLEVAVLTDRAQGGSSLEDGNLELMVHRNCMHDDAFGVGEALNEQAYGTGKVARGSHYLTIGSSDSKSGKTIAAIERDIAQRKLLAPWVFLSTPKETNWESYRANHPTEFQGLTDSLPDNVQILTLEPWKGFSFLIRLEHVLEKNEDPELSKPVTVNIEKIFTPFNVTEIKETTLGGNQWLKDNQRLHFTGGDNIEDVLQYFPKDRVLDELRSKYMANSPNFENYVKREAKDQIDSGFDITLNPMQIRTFVVEV